MNYFHKKLVFTKYSPLFVRIQLLRSAANVELAADIISKEVDEDTVSAPARNFDKSGLRQQHKNVLYENPPYQEANSWIHQTEKYQRKMFGRYGSKSNVNPQICFDSIAEGAKNTDITQLDTLQQMLEKCRIQKAEKLNAINIRENDIMKKLEKLEQWKRDLNAKVAKREADAAAAIKRKERLIEEVRRHFGFKVDPRDDRFKELLEQKEKEDKRKQKEAKRKVKEEKMMAKLMEKSPT